MPCAALYFALLNTRAALDMSSLPCAGIVPGSGKLVLVENVPHLDLTIFRLRGP